MRKSLILPITLASLMMVGVVGCTVESGESVPVSSIFTANSVTITNKEALQEAWSVLDGTRTVNLSGDPAWANLNDAVNAGLITITSSDSTVISVNKRVLTPLKVGKATITATYGGKTDSVECEIIVKTAKQLYGTDHEGTAEDPFSNEDAVKVGEAEPTGTAVEYYIKGTVDAWYHFPGENAAYCSWFMKPATAEGKRFEAYKIAKVSGEGETVTKASPTVDEVYPGAVVTVKGKITTYSGQVETDTGTWIAKEATPEKPAMTNVPDKTCTEIMALEVADGNTTWDTYTITGYVQKADGNNFFVADAKLGDGTFDATKTIEVYGYDVATRGLAEGSADTEVVKDAKIQVNGHIKNYHGQFETVVCEQIKVLEAGVAVKPTEVTIEDAIAAGNALVQEEKGTATGDVLYKTTGYVCKMGSWSNDKGKGDFYIAAKADESDATKQIQVYGYTKQEVYSKLKTGAKVVVTGYMSKYNSGSSTKLEIIGPTVEIDTLPAEFAEVLTVIDGLENNGATEYKYSFIGYIVDLGTWDTTFNNATLKVAAKADETDAAKMIVLFRFKDSAVYETLALGDYIRVTCAVQKYFKDDTVTPESKGTIVIEKLVKPVEGSKVSLSGVASEMYVLSTENNVNLAAKFGLDETKFKITAAVGTSGGQTGTKDKTSVTGTTITANDKVSARLNTSGNIIQLYGTNTMTFAGLGNVTIVGIKFTIAGGALIDITSGEIKTVTGNSITVTVSGSTQCKITGVEITYTEA